MAKTKNSKISLSHLFFLLAGLLFLVYFLLKNGIPSPGSSLVSLMNFLVELFILIVVVGFYFCFLFLGKNCAGSIKAIAPSLLVLILVGNYSMNFGSAEANAIISGIASLFYVLVLACGFVFLFIHSKLLGLVFSYSSLVYASFVIASYLVVMIMDLVNGGAFSFAKMMETSFFIGGLVFLFLGGYRISRGKEWAF